MKFAVVALAASSFLPALSAPIRDGLRSRIPVLARAVEVYARSEGRVRKYSSFAFQKHIKNSQDGATPKPAGNKEKQQKNRTKHSTGSTSAQVTAAHESSAPAPAREGSSSPAGSTSAQGPAHAPSPPLEGSDSGSSSDRGTGSGSSGSSTVKAPTPKPPKSALEQTTPAPHGLVDK